MSYHPKPNKRRFPHDSEWNIRVYDPSEEVELTEDNCYVTLSTQDMSKDGDSTDGEPVLRQQPSHP